MTTQEAESRFPVEIQQLAIGLAFILVIVVLVILKGLLSSDESETVEEIEIQIDQGLDEVVDQAS